MSTESARWWDWLAALLLLVCLSIAADRLVVTHWTYHLELAQSLTLLGILVGLALGQSRFSWRLAAGLALALGLFAIPWRFGLTLDRAIPWTERLLILANRLLESFGQLARRQAVLDPVLFLSLVATLSWTISVQAGYALTRHADPWRACLPSGAVMLIVHTYDGFVPSRIWYLAVYAFLTLLLLVRLTYLRNRVQWQEHRIPLPVISSNSIAILVISSALLVLAAWILPAAAHALPSVEDAWQRITQPWDGMRERLGHAFASLRDEDALANEYYGDRYPLGYEREFTNAVLFTVRTDSQSATRMRLYWRARVYDYYGGGQWNSLFNSVQHVTPTDFDVSFPTLEGRQIAAFEFAPTVPMVTLSIASQPLWVSRPARMDLTTNPDGTVDLGSLRATPYVRSDETYQARSSLGDFTVAQLRGAGTDYPLWIADRYLQLPPTITPRTRELAGRIAQDLETPYDAAAAITEYLRTQIPYTDTMPAPPIDQEPLDWFLFDLRQGFCNYYASAEVVMLRSLGIPARLAVGFAQGQQDSQGNTYLVRGRDAHAWPEVYFPDLGWVEFEPTASLPPIGRPLGGADESRAGAGGIGSPTGGAEGYPLAGLEDLMDLKRDSLDDQYIPDDVEPGLGGRTVALHSVLFLALGLLAIILAWRMGRQRGLPPLPVVLEEGLRRFDLGPPGPLRLWAVWATLPPMERAYLELNLALARLDAPPIPSDTPAERAASLTRLLPAAAIHIRRLAAEYQATVYSPRLGDVEAAQTASRTVRYLSWWAAFRSWWVALRRRFNRALRPLKRFSRRLEARSYQSYHGFH